MITAMPVDTLQALKQVRQTHGFETMLEIALYCFRVVSRAVSRPYHGPQVNVVQPELAAQAAPEGCTAHWESRHPCYWTCFRK